MPTVPALLDHVLGLIHRNSSLEKRPEPTATRKRVRVQAPEGLEEPDHAPRCDETIADLDRECSTADKTVSGDDPSGYTTPPPTKMTKLERFRLTCGPLKMPRRE